MQQPSERPAALLFEKASIRLIDYFHVAEKWAVGSRKKNASAQSFGSTIK
jgi:hypothetical protein